MKVLYDGYIYKVQKAGGIGRYFNNIIKRLPEDLVPILTTYNGAQNIELPQHKNLNQIDYVPFRPYRLSAKAEKYYFRVKNNLTSYNILHPTYYTLLTSTQLSEVKKPIVITIHDMIYELFQDIIEDAAPHIQWKKDAIHAAHSIICVSENTKLDLLKFYPQVENKIEVIYEGSEIEYQDSFNDEEVPESPYFIYVGSRAVYKNFNLLLEAYSLVCQQSKNVKLCVVGPAFTEAELKLINDLHLEHQIVYFGFVSSKHLAKLYRCSLALVYPSLYEGFGLPPLEAMTSGTVVISSNLSCIPEIVGDAAILVNPYSKDELAQAMISAIRNEFDRNSLIEKGFQRTKEFDWDKNVAKIVNIYKKILN